MVALALFFAAVTAVHAGRDLSSYGGGVSGGAFKSSFDFVNPGSLDFVAPRTVGHTKHSVTFVPASKFAGKKVISYDPVRIAESVPEEEVIIESDDGPCGEGQILVTSGGGYGGSRKKCVNKKEDVPSVPDVPEEEIVVKPECPEPRKFVVVDGSEVCTFVCPEGFKQIGDSEECEEDIPEVQNVTVDAEAPSVTVPEGEVAVATVPEEPAPVPVVAPEEPVVEVETVPEVAVAPTEEPEDIPVTLIEPLPSPVPEPAVPTTPLAPPVVQEPVPEPTVENGGPGTCPPGSFFMEKVESRGCTECDSNCTETGCEDLTGCTVCEPGFFTQREDVDWPFMCISCESAIPGCAKCSDGITLELGETVTCVA